MNSKISLYLLSLSMLLLAGCQSNNLGTENEALKQKITELEQQITELEQQNGDMNSFDESTPVAETAAQNNENTQNSNGENSSNNNGNTQNSNNNNSTANATTYTMEELTEMVDKFTVSVGSATPDINNSGNLDQFFSLKKEADKIEHALENHENSLEDQYRAGTLSREEYRTLDKEIEKLEDLLDLASDRLEVAFGIDD